MNAYLIALILGIVEGLTEFLPVSSTAHIRLVQDCLKINLNDEYWKMFAIVIQLGAILSVVVFFNRRLINFVKSFFGLPIAAGSDPAPAAPRTWLKHPLVLVMIAFVVTALPCYLIDKKIGENLESLKIIALSLLIGGVAMWIVDAYFSRRAKVHSIEAMTLPQAIVIGFFQIFAAAFPGTSRSMATIAGGQMMGLSRSAALEFSFFLSIPVMVAATSFKLLQFIRKTPIAMTGEQWGVLAVGFAVSFVVALACIAWFMGWVRRRGFMPFAIYRIVLGSAVLIWVFQSGR